MKNKLLLKFTILFLILPVLGKAQTLPLPDHIVIFVLENKSYEQIIEITVNAPYINQLAKSGALFTQFYALTHPSQPNYLMMFSGSNQGINNNSYPTAAPWNRTIPFHTPNMGACLISKGYTFKGYAQGLPSVGYLGVNSGKYYSKHAVYSYWQGEGLNTIPDSSNQPFSNFPTDFNLLPTVSYVIPDSQYSMHDGTILQGDSWLKNNMDAYITWAKTHNSLFILTFDEGRTDSDNRIVTIISGQNVVAGRYNEKLNHYNLLRTIEDIYGICYTSANDSAASPITSCWDSSVTSTNEIKTPLNNIRIFPNPFSSSTTLQSDISFKEATLTVYNPYGQVVREMKNISGNTVTLFRENLPNGLYFIELTQDHKIIKTDKLLLTD
jgi:hypothetical protein